MSCGQGQGTEKRKGEVRGESRDEGRKEERAKSVGQKKTW